ncbi:hypothetical protein MYK68_09000 [Gordonia sp. PP30]|uniref:hypothetical protein n=1 Tax=Gordonia sp. PP30 TaxID=2935861 RepID=UPI001FFE85DF|nr:hypothetical protein [Gordonia sp. PP30]UQE76675.1 hypothetical protein MYK68_09000 [Gordonia sp. PP30]
MPDSDDAQRRRVAERFARALEVTGRGLRLLIFAIAALAALLGVIAMAVGIVTWRHADQWRLPIGVMIVILLCLPAVALPIVAHRRLAPLTRAIERPDNLARQARDYAADVRSGTELSDLASLAADAPTTLWRPGTLWRMARLVGAFTARVTPDAERQPLLAAFMPVYLKTLWLVLVVTVWALGVAVVVLAGSLIAALAGWTPSS